MPASNITNTIIIFFGYFECSDISYLEALAETSPDLISNIHLLGWQSQQRELQQLSRIYKVDLVDDPGSVPDLNHRLININRQLTHWHFILNYYPSHIILKLRPDTRLYNLKQLSRILSDYIASTHDQLWLLNATTSSPRILNIVQLQNHYCDWLVLGHTKTIVKSIRASLIDEHQIINSTLQRQGLVLRARKKQSEQLLFVNLDSTMTQIHPAKFYGIAFSKYPQSFRRNASPYSLISMNELECLLFNHNHKLLLKLYPPVIRLLFYLLFLLRSILASKSFRVSI